MTSPFFSDPHWYLKTGFLRHSNGFLMEETNRILGVVVGMDRMEY